MKTSLLPFSSQLQINHPLGRKLLMLCHLSAVIIPLFIRNLWTSILFISLIKAQMHRPTNIRHLSTHQHRTPPYSNLLYAVEKSRPPGLRSMVEIPKWVWSAHHAITCYLYSYYWKAQLSHHTCILIHLWNMSYILHRFEILLASLSQAYQMS